MKLKAVKVEQLQLIVKQKDKGVLTPKSKNNFINIEECVVYTNPKEGQLDTNGKEIKTLNLIGMDLIGCMESAIRRVGDTHGTELIVRSRLDGIDIRAKLLINGGSPARISSVIDNDIEALRNKNSLNEDEITALEYFACPTFNRARDETGDENQYTALYKPLLRIKKSAIDGLADKGYITISGDNIKVNISED
jgi:hypothetical protein